jgi:DNA-binding MarR family transcriptional regulator
MTLREYIFNLSQFYRVNIRAAVNASELGLNGMHVRCLHFIAQNNECTANCIVKRMGRDKAQIARLIKEMLDKGWLVKHVSEQDKRSQILTLSASGQQLQQKINQLERELEKTIVSGLSSQDVFNFKRITEIMLNNLKETEHKKTKPVNAPK